MSLHRVAAITAFTGVALKLRARGGKWARPRWLATSRPGYAGSLSPVQAIISTGLHREGVTSARPAGGGNPQPLRWLAVPAAYLVGAIPFSNIAARRLGGVDLRRVGTGTVSGTGLFAVAGLGPLMLAGILDVAKGAVGPLLAGGDDPVRRALAAAAGVSGHNWSPWLSGAGGRGISPAIGALLPAAPAGAATLLAGLAGGRAAGETAVGCLVADAAVVPVSARAHGRDGALCAAGVLVPILAKRLAGNAPPARRRPTTYVWRLVFDRDVREKGAARSHLVLRRAARPVGARP